MTVLFICTANIVRSFLAERILKGKLAKFQRGDIFVQSAGMMDMQGAPGDPTAEKLLAEHGFDGRFHTSRLLSEELLEQADLIAVMEDSQRRQLITVYPRFEEKIRLLKSFARDYDGVNTDIKDPYKQSIYNYRLCFAEIYTAVDGMVKCI